MVTLLSFTVVTSPSSVLATFKMEDENIDNEFPRRPITQYYTQPNGGDAPTGTYQKAWKRQAVHITFFDDDSHIKCNIRFILNSQQPCVQLEPIGGNGDSILFPLQSSELECSLNTDTDPTTREIFARKTKEHAFLREPRWSKFALYRLLPLSEPIIPFVSNRSDNEGWKILRERSWVGKRVLIWRTHDPKWFRWPIIQDWLTTIQEDLKIGMPDGKRQGFWHYRTHKRDNHLQPFPPPQWLFEKPIGNRPPKSKPWDVKTPLYIDMNEFKCRIIEPLKNERNVQRAQVENVYNHGIIHRARLVSLNNGRHQQLLIKLGVTQDETMHNPPDISPGTLIKFLPVGLLGREIGIADLRYEGAVVNNDADNEHDLIVSIRDPIHDTTGFQFLVATYIKANLFAIDRQLAILASGIKMLSFEDQPSNKAQGLRGVSLNSRRLLFDSTYREHPHRGLSRPEPIPSMVVQ
ncbi:hypothetical protein BJX99DRAFT_254943 [Aspergillus californicus]